MESPELIERLISAPRERGLHGDVRVAPAFYDLPPEARERAFQLTVVQRTLESRPRSGGALHHRSRLAGATDALNLFPRSIADGGDIALTTQFVEWLIAWARSNAVIGKRRRREVESPWVEKLSAYLEERTSRGC
jgi:hypothetical protein